MKIPAIVNHETVYYTINYWEDKTTWGKSIDIAYKTAKNALARAKIMIESNKYDSIMVRKETVYKRNEHCEISVSSPYKHFERQV